MNTEPRTWNPGDSLILPPADNDNGDHQLDPYTPEDRPHIFWRCVECATAHGVRPDELPENTDA